MALYLLIKKDERKRKRGKSQQTIAQFKQNNNKHEREEVL